MRSNIYIIQNIFIYFHKRKITENVLQNKPNCTIDKKSGEYTPIPLNIMCAVIHYLLFLYEKRIFLQLFFYKFLAKYSPNPTKLRHFLKFSRGSIPPNPPSKRVASPRAGSHALHGASRHANTPTFTKNILNPPPK